MSKKLFMVVNVDWFFLSHRKPIALAAQKDGYDVTIVTNNTGKLKIIEDLGLKVVDMPMNRSGQNLKEELCTLKFLYRLYKREKPDIIHHVGLKSIIWGTLAAKFAGMNAVVNAISGLGVLFSNDVNSHKTAIILRILRFAHKQKHIAAIFQNNDDQEIFLSHHIIKENQCYITKGSGVNLLEYCYTPEPIDRKIKVIFTGRMVIEKGVLIIVDAANKLRKEYEDKVEFILCGGIDDNPNAITKEQLGQVCDGKYIQWLGYRTDVLQLLKKSHVVAFPSYYREGIPKSLIEATAVGRPIVTTNSIGCKETVNDGYNGYLIPIKNSDALAEKLKILFEDKKLRITMGQNSRNFAEKNFSVEDVIKTHLEVYSALLK